MRSLTNKPRENAALVRKKLLSTSALYGVVPEDLKGCFLLHEPVHLLRSSKETLLWMPPPLEVQLVVIQDKAFSKVATLRNSLPMKVYLVLVHYMFGC